MREFLNKYYRENKNFVTYTWTGIVFTGANIFLVWLGIDIFRFPTLPTTITVIGGLFLLRFWLYKKLGFTS